MITDTQIEALRNEAETAGDYVMAGLCTLALRDSESGRGTGSVADSEWAGIGQSEARAECERVIIAARVATWWEVYEIERNGRARVFRSDLATEADARAWADEAIPGGVVDDNDRCVRAPRVDRGTDLTMAPGRVVFWRLATE